ncbi:bifunctional diguanylate cyclase/phosphodiesterase [Robertmurraya sp. P23]|uniref:bifunctional diguanylate cyclase/phosphodiesterase n=1 Tax=Robertmurraya sp. P23 TaxID=3436931 RepID=UPI003D98985B
MDKTLNRQYGKISIIILLFIVSELIEFFIPHNSFVFKVAHYIFVLMIIILLFYLTKRINKHTTDLNETNQRLSTIFDTLDVAIWSMNLKTNKLLITPGIEKLYGYPLSDFYENTELWKETILEEDSDVLEERKRKIEKGEAVTSVYRIRRPNGEIRWIQDRGIPILDTRGTLIDFTSVLFDITILRESEERYRSLVEMSPTFIAIIKNGKLDYLNLAGYQLLGISDDQPISKEPVTRFMRIETISDIKNRMIKDDFERNLISYETVITDIHGKEIAVELSVLPIKLEGRPVFQIIGKDITERKKAEETIHNMAYYDTLTGLGNRNKLKEQLVHATSLPTKFTVLFLDLDRFKVINDTKGHSTGDLILRDVAQRLNTIIGKKGSVYRHSGDEFIVVLSCHEVQKIEQVADSVLRDFNIPFEISGEEYYLTTSIGISRYPEDGEDQETLIKHADTAMYLAKEHGKNNYQFYTSQLDEIKLRKLELENGLRKSIELNQFSLFYQPKFHLKSKEIVGTEALLRWFHPTLGVVSPIEFIPLAEETGMIVDIGKWVLKEAVRQNKKWQDTGLKPVSVAVNISVRQLLEEDFIEFVENTLTEYNLDPKYLELEITETIMQDIENSILVLNKLKKLGISIAIDDFGTGYSSLSYLKHLPIDTIKIDKSFLDDLEKEAGTNSIVKAIIEMGRTLKFDVIAEGIETEFQAKYLINNYCVHGQGYIFSKPVRSEEIEALLV